MQVCLQNVNGRVDNQLDSNTGRQVINRLRTCHDRVQVGALGDLRLYHT